MESFINKEYISLKHRKIHKASAWIKYVRLIILNFHFDNYEKNVMKKKIYRVCIKLMEINKRSRLANDAYDFRISPDERRM